MYLKQALILICTFYVLQTIVIIPTTTHADLLDPSLRQSQVLAIRKSSFKPPSSFLMCSQSHSADTTGVIYDSGGASGDYQNFQNCGFLIFPPCSDSIKLSFSVFDLENGYDFLQIYDGGDATAPLLYSGSGNTLPHDLIAYSGRMFLKFTSDGSIAQSGFEANWESFSSSSTNPVASFAVGDLNPPLGAPVSFTDQSTGNPVSWYWDFGDGDTSRLMNPVHVFLGSGVFTVSLIVNNCLGVADTIQQTLTVQAPAQLSYHSPTYSATVIDCGDSVAFPLTLLNAGQGPLIYSLQGQPRQFSPVVISKIGLYTQKGIELTNVSGGSADISGWRVLVSNSFSNINSYDSQVWNLSGSIGSGEVQYRTNHLGPNYWGGNLLWGYTQPGWAMLINDQGQVKDVLVWGWSAADISQMHITYNGWNLSLADGWKGNGVSDVCTNFITRSGTEDLNNASNFACTADVLGSFNPLLILPFPNSTSSMIDFQPSGGTLLAGDSVLTSVTFHTKGLIPGIYTGQIAINSNDTAQFSALIPYTFTYVGTPYIALDTGCWVVDSTAQYGTYPQEFWVWNTGCDTIVASQTYGKGAYFEIQPPIQYILPGDSGAFTVLFSPDTVGNYQDSFTLFNNDYDTTICLEGYGFGVAEIDVFPDSIYVQITQCDDSVKIPLYIENVGAAELDYQVNNIDTTVFILYEDFEKGNYDNWVRGWQFYTYNTSTVAPRSGSYSLKQDGRSFTFYRGLSRSFPNSQPSYVGFWIKASTTNANATYVAIGDTNELPGGGQGGIGLFSTKSNGTMGLFNVGPNLSATIPYQANVWYHIEYRNIDFTAKTLDFYIDGQLIYQGFPFRQKSNQVNEIRLFNYDPSISYYDDIIIAHQAPNGATWLEVQPDMGSVPAGQTDTLSVCISARDVNRGRYWANVHISSNAPLSPAISIPVVLDIVGTSEMVFERNCLFLDTTRQFTSSQDTFWLYNPSCVPLVLDSLKFAESAFAVDSFPSMIPPYDSGQVAISFHPDSMKLYTDSLRIYSNEIDTFLCVQGYGSGSPIIEIVPDTVNLTAVGCDDSIWVPITIYNRGLGTMTYTSTGAEGVFDSLSIIPYYYSGWSTVHTFTNLRLRVDSLYVTVVLNGDYDDTFEFSSLYIEGQYQFDIIDNNLPNGTDITQTYVFSGPQVSSWVADGQVEVKITNNIQVNTNQGGLNRHQVQMQTSTATPSWMQYLPSAATILPGDSLMAQLLVLANGLISGSNQGDAFIQSNDPRLPVDEVYINLDLIGVPALGLPSGCVMVDTTRQFATRHDSLWLYNTQCAPLTLDSLYFLDTFFSVISYPDTIPPFDSMQVFFAFAPDSVIAYSDSLQIKANGQDTALCVQGNGSESPILRLFPDSLTVSITGCEDTLCVPVAVYNDGLAPLEFKAVGDHGLEDLLANLNLNFGQINSLIPGRHDFTDGISGTSILDGGDDMYDGGNILNTDLADSIPYSDNQVLHSQAFGLKGRYFTRKYPGLFVLAADLDRLSHFAISGELGADGYGFVGEDELVLTENGITYRGFVKQVYNSGDPSVYHMIIVEDDPAVSRSYSTNTNDDIHRVSGLTKARRIYYLVFSRATGGSIHRTLAIPIMQAFVELIPPSFGATWATVQPDSIRVALGDYGIVNFCFDARRVENGLHTALLELGSNDPKTPLKYFPLQLEIIGAPQIELPLGCFVSDTTRQQALGTDTLWVHNTGCDTLKIADITLQTAYFNLDTTSLHVLPFDSAFLQVNFIPDSAGIFRDTLHIQNNDRDTSICLEGIGTGGPLIRVEPNPVFATIPGCDSVLTLPLTLINDGLDSLFYRLNEAMYDSTHFVLFGSFGGNTTRTFTNIAPIYDTLILSVTLSGDFSSFNEFANLYIDGFYFQRINPSSSLSTTQVVLTGPMLQTWLSDGELEVRLRNFAVTNYSNSYHEVKLQGTANTPWLSYFPAIDSIEMQDSSQVLLDFDATGLASGLYQSTLFVQSNDPRQPVIPVPVTMQVIGQEIVTLSDTALNFDSVSIGYSRSIPFTYTNLLCDTLTISSITSNSPAFTINQSNLVILPFDSAQVNVTFTPTLKAAYNGQLTLINSYQDTTISLRGVGVGTPIIGTTPDSVNVTLDACGDSALIPLNITNQGDGSLRWQVNAKVQVMDDFEKVVNTNSLWFGISGGKIDNPCGTYQGTGAMYFEGSGGRMAESQDLVTSEGGLVEFALKYGTNSTGTCEKPDLGEEVVWEYSTDGGSNWQVMETFGINDYPSFTLIQRPIPSAAQTAATRFRWRQKWHSGQGYDSWAIDAVTITVDASDKLQVVALPDSGSTPALGATAMMVKVKVDQLHNGQYPILLNITSNDPLTPQLAVPGIVTVIGQPTINLGQPAPASLCDGDSILLKSDSLQNISWSTGDTSSAIWVKNTGSYSVTLSKPSGCQVTSPAVSIFKNAPLLTYIQKTGTNCAGGILDLSVSGGTAPYQYAWNTGATTQDLTLNAAGSYTVVVTDALGCTVMDSFTVSTIATMNVSAVKTDATCPGTATGTIDLTVSGGQAPFTYLWSNGASTQDLNGVNAGQYTVNVMDVSGCMASDSITINQPMPIIPVVTASDTTAFCMGDSVRLNGPVGYQAYAWTNGDSTASITVLQNGTFALTVTDSLGCESMSSASTQVTVNTLPSQPMVTPLGPTTFCADDSVALVGPAGYASYLWSDGTTDSLLFARFSGNFFVSVIDSNGCKSPASTALSVTVHPLPPQPMITGTSDFCAGDSSQLMTSPNYVHYNWSNGDTTHMTTVHTTASLTVSVVDQNGCESPVSAAFATMANPLPATPVVVASDTTVFCLGDSVSLSGPSGYTTYTWTNSANASSITVLQSGTFALAVIDSNGCGSPLSAPVQVTVNPLPPPPTIVGDSVFCPTDSVILAAPTGYVGYTWSNGDTTRQISVKTAGTYTVVVTHQNACNSLPGSPFQTTHHALPPKPIITPQALTRFCEGDSVLLTAPLGYPGYQWSNGDTLEGIWVKMSEIFRVSVTDSNGCESVLSDSLEVVVDSLPAKPLILGTPEFCAGDSTILTGPIGYAQYFWSNGDTTAGITLMTPATLILSVIDHNGCRSPQSDTFFVQENSLPPQPIILGDTFFCEGDSTLLQAPLGYALYQWSNGAGDSAIWVTLASKYSVTVTDHNGCVSMAADSVSVGQFLNSPKPILVKIGVDSLTSSVVGTRYMWYLNGMLLPDSTQTIHIPQNGNYTVTVWDGPCPSDPSDPLLINTDIDDQWTGASIAIFPNPSDGHFFVKGQLTQASLVEIKVYTQIGQEIYHKDFYARQGKLDETIILGDIASGIYLVRLRVNNNLLYQKLEILK